MRGRKLKGGALVCESSIVRYGVLSGVVVDDQGEGYISYDIDSGVGIGARGMPYSTSLCPYLLRGF